MNFQKIIFFLFSFFPVFFFFVVVFYFNSVRTMVKGCTNQGTFLVCIWVTISRDIKLKNTVLLHLEKDLWLKEGIINNAFYRYEVKIHILLFFGKCMRTLSFNLYIPSNLSAASKYFSTKWKKNSIGVIDTIPR